MMADPGGRGLAVAGLHLAVLWSFAVAQPLLDLLGDAPEFFVARENTAGDIVLLAIVVTVVPPVLLCGLEALVGRLSVPAGRSLHLVLVAALTAAFVLPLLDDTGGAAVLLIAAAVAVGAVAAVLYARSRVVGLLLTVLSPAPLVFVLVFLLVSPVSKLVLPDDAAASSDAKASRGAPVVMIIFDELSGPTLMRPDGRIDASRFPNFARLAADATWYRNATTVADFSERAVPALLTGEQPEPDAAPIAADHPESLFSLLGGDYAFHVIEPITDVCPKRLCPVEGGTRESTSTRWRKLASDLGVVQLHLLLPEDLARDLPPVDRSFEDFGGPQAGDGRAADDGDGFGGPLSAGGRFALDAATKRPRRVQEFASFTEEIARGAGGRRLDFLHVQLPHSPYEFLPSGQRYPNGADLPGKPFDTWGRDRVLIRQGLQRYLLQLRYTDLLLGRALDRLRATGRYDRSLVAVTADHGVSFRPGAPDRRAGERNLVPIAAVPLIVKAPGQRRGRVDDANVRTTDLLPTVAARLGIRMPWPVDGRLAEQREPVGRVTVDPREGAKVSLRFEEFVRRRDALVRRMTAAFGPGASGLYAGPDRDLLRREVATLSPRSARGEVDLEQRAQLENVAPEGPVVPALLRGEVSGLAPGARLAVAVNGRVAATTLPYTSEGVARFTALVPPSSFTRGRNSVDLLAVTGAGSRRRVALLQSARAHRLVSEGGREVIVDDAGARFAVAPSGGEGYVDAVTASGTRVTVIGWAGSTDPPRPAQRVVAFVERRFLDAARPEVARPELAKTYGRPLARAGFRLDGEAGARGDDAERELRVYALTAGRAVRIPGPGADTP